MRKEELYFESRDNKTKIHAIRYMPDSENVVGIVQIVHGMAEHIERYEEFAKFLTERNILVALEDHLGHGKSVGEDGIKGYFCERDAATVLIRDSHRLKKLTQELYPGVPYIIIGHSMGSYMVNNYICRYGKGINAAILMGTGRESAAFLMFSKFMCGIQKLMFGEKHIAKLLDKGTFSSYNKRVENPRTDKDWLTKDAKKVDEYIADEDCGFVFTVNGFRTLTELVSRARKKDNLKNIPKNLPILVMAGDSDPVGNYGKGVKSAYEALLDAGLTNVGLKLYEGDRHELLNETDREQVMQDIYHWMDLIISEDKYE